MLTLIVARYRFGLALWVSLMGGIAAAAPNPQPRFHCETLPRADWMSWQEVEARLKENGMRLVRLRMGDDRCYSVVALDGHGEYRTLLMHPVNGRMTQVGTGDPTPKDRWRMPWRKASEP